MTIGVLAIQGDYEAHKARLEQLGAHVTLVRKPEQLDAIDGIVIPGGESSTFLNFLAEHGFLEKLRDFVSTKPTFGTCAGAILLAKEVENPPQASLGALDMVFIRATKIVSTGKEVEVLATAKGDPVLVRQGKVMASTFHPELSNDTRVHQEFLKLVKNGVGRKPG